MKRTLWLAVVGCISVGQARAQAVPITVIEDAVSCATCRVELFRSLTLLPPDSLSGAVFSVHMDGRGRYWGLQPGALPMLFDESGKFVRMIGRPGRGPGEMIGATLIAPFNSDSLLLFDALLRRATIYSSSLAAGRSVSLNVPLDALVNVGGKLIGSGYVGTPEAAGLPLHEIALDGPIARIARSFGTNEDLQGDFATILNFRLGASGGGGMWSAEVVRYHFALWSPDLKLEKRFVRKAGWFNGVSVYSAGTPTRPPDPRTIGIAEDSAGLVWIVTNVAGPDWRSAWPTNVPKNSEIRGRDIQVEKLYVTVIEVIDPRRAAVVARTRLDRVSFGLLPGPRLVAYEVTPDGDPLLRVHMLRLLQGR